jgi:hypothetical protein
MWDLLGFLAKFLANSTAVSCVELATQDILRSAWGGSLSW